MNTTIISFKNTTVGNDTQHMTSLEIAELTGKPHNDILKAIRKMEPAWTKVNGGNFSLVEYCDKKGELRPCYSLTKTECLYIATKFNDEARAKQVAKTFNMTVYDFNAVLRDMGIQYRRGGRWNISDDLADRDFVRFRTHVSYSLKGEKKVKTYMTWTMAGLHYLNSKLGYPNF